MAEYGAISPNESHAAPLVIAYIAILALLRDVDTVKLLDRALLILKKAGHTVLMLGNR